MIMAVQKSKKKKNKNKKSVFIHLQHMPKVQAQATLHKG